MTEQVMDMMMNSGDLGKVEIAPEVLEVIASIAASEIEGIAKMKTGFATGVVERLGRKNYGKGVKVDIRDEGIFIDVYCTVQFGVSIPTVAQKVQDNIRQALYNMTALEANEINVHIVNVQFDTKEANVEE